MGWVLATVALALGLFAGTNIDDMVVLAVLNASSRVGGRPRVWQIWAGQYAGVTVLVIISMLAALGFRLVPEHWIWLLGLIPLGLGLRKLVMAVGAHRSGERASAAVATGLPEVVGLTVANGGDNIAAYTPVFRTITTGGLALTIAVFAVCVALWCLCGSWLVSHRAIATVVERWGHWIIPAVYLLIGLYVFHKAAVF
jgi:cadmium resistance protein CadD (predicted permease)